MYNATKEIIIKTNWLKDYWPISEVKQAIRDIFEIYNCYECTIDEAIKTYSVSNYDDLIADPH